MEPALAISGLCKSFSGTRVVNDLSFAIEAGEIFGLLGPNGAGKSTTINMVAGVTRIDSGSAAVFGHDTRADYRTTRRLVGVMHQEIVTDNFFTIDRALKIHAGYYGVPSDPVWRQRLIDRLGLGPHLHKPMNKLSGGLKRRFMVAKALIHKPRLLILDEPTAGVDVELRHSLWRFVREINGEGTTVLLTTHYLEEAEQMCERIAIMNHGRLVTLEKTGELLARVGEKTLLLHLGSPLQRLPEEFAGLGAQLVDSRTLSLTMVGGANAAQALALLGRMGVTVVEMETEKAGLEEVFIQLTGSGQRAGEGG